MHPTDPQKEEGRTMEQRAMGHIKNTNIIDLTIDISIITLGVHTLKNAIKKQRLLGSI